MKTDPQPNTSWWANMTQEQITQKEHELESMKTLIESLSKTQHIEILNILRKNSAVKINENRNGVYINMSYLPLETVEEITKYLDYIKDQERNLEQFEMKKEEFKQFL
jgi:hypothetical protein